MVFWRVMTDFANGTLSTVNFIKFKKKINDKDFHQTEKSEKALTIAKVKRLAESLYEAQMRLKEDKDFFSLMIAMYAVGISVANCDGCIAPQERIDIEEFIAGISSSKLPPHIKRIIAQLYNKPPDFNTAIKYVEKVPYNDWIFFDNVIDLVSRSDNKIDKMEIAYKKAWNEFKATVVLEANDEP